MKEKFSKPGSGRKRKCEAANDVGVTKELRTTQVGRNTVSPNIVYHTKSVFDANWISSELL